MGAGLVRVLRAVFGVDRMQVGLRGEFATRAYRVSAERGLRVCWAVLLFDLPLFALIDWATYTSGQWPLQPAHERVFWWRVTLVICSAVLLASREFIGDERRRDTIFAWCCALGFPLFGAWFTVICQTLITDASIYALFLIGTSVVFPLPGLRKLPDDALRIGALGHVLDVFARDLAREILLHREPRDVVLMRPSRIADRADVDKADLQRFPLLASHGQGDGDGTAGKRGQRASAGHVGHGDSP